MCISIMLSYSDYIAIEFYCFNDKNLMIETHGNVIAQRNTVMKYESPEQVREIFELQGKKRWTMAQTTADERIAKLKALRAAIVRRQEEFYRAVWDDFHKPRFEAWLCEVFPTIEEIDEAIRHLKSWMADRRGTWLYFLPTTHSRTHFEPKGRVLIMSPWNYPFLLSMCPLISAIAAGNVVMSKPSQKTPRVSEFLASLLEEVFPGDEVAVIQGAGKEVGDVLLGMPFDHIFFTGSPKIGSHVGQMAQKVYASLTLELGGKSPVVILPEVNLGDAAKKLSWGKTLNAGQTCVAPDYVLCPRRIMDDLGAAIASEIKARFGETEEERRRSDDFVHIIDQGTCEKHQAMVKDALLKGAKCHLSGQWDVEARYSPATVLTRVTMDMDLMKSEIFGPILPIIPYDDLHEAIQLIRERPKPLALYVFGTSKRAADKILTQTTSGSACVNHTIIQIENLSVPFGGVGMSGTGNYHGIYGFKTFSHERNIMVQSSLMDAVSFFFPPYHRQNDRTRHGKLQALMERGLRIFKRM